MPPAAGGRKPPASPATAPQATRQSAASTRSPITGSVKSPLTILPPPSSPSSRLVLGSRSNKRAAPNGRPNHGSGKKSHKKRRRERSSSSDSEADGSSVEEEEDNGDTPSQRNGSSEHEMPRRYSIRPQPPPAAPPTTKGNSVLNTIHNYFATATAALSSSSSSSSPASSSASPSSSHSTLRSSTPPAVSSDVAAVLSVVSPHEANVARQASAMKRIARLHAQLQSDMTWDPGKREGKEEKAEAEEDDDEDEEEHKEEDEQQQHSTAAPITRPFTTPRRKGRPPPLNSSLIQTPPFRLLSANTAPRSASAQVSSNTRRTQAAPAVRRSTATSNTTASSPAALSPTPSNLPAAVFTRRHLPLARAERRMRAEQRRESTEHWITCDACSKWRLLPPTSQPHHSPTQPTPPTPPHYYCGGTSSPNPAECVRLDDWIVRCVGEGRAVQLGDVGVDTVEVLVGASGKRRRELERAMERLGMEFDSVTQKINCFSVTRDA